MNKKTLSKAGKTLATAKWKDHVKPSTKEYNQGYYKLRKKLEFLKNIAIDALAIYAKAGMPECGIKGNVAYEALEQIRGMD